MPCIVGVEFFTQIILGTKTQWPPLSCFFLFVFFFYASIASLSLKMFWEVLENFLTNVGCILKRDVTKSFNYHFLQICSSRFVHIIFIALFII